MPEQLFIQNQKDLDQFVSQISQHDWVSLDTEFLRTKTYYAKLCLIQIAIPDYLAIIDVIQDDLDLSGFYSCLMERTLVMHACRQDLEVLYNQCKQMPKAVFDTQLAAAFVGFRDQIGYANLVEEMIDVKLKKSHTRTNWEQRPLSPGQLEYAYDDVRYLHQIFPILRDRLKDLGRQTWYQEEMLTQLQVEWVCGDPQQSWERVRGIKQLKPKQMTIAQGLAQWREQTAQQLDRPRNWILKDEDLLMLAKRQPKTEDELNKVNKSLANGKFAKILPELINEFGQSLPAQTRECNSLTEQQKDLVDTLSIAIRLIGQKHQLQPNLLATRKQIESLVIDTDKVVFTGWRQQIVSDEIYGLLNGQYVLKIKEGKPILTQTPNPLNK